MDGMKLTFANVGYGEAILLQVPDARRSDGMFVMLIDGGSGEEEEFAGSSTGRRPLIDFLHRKGIGHLDLLVNTHIHEDHTCGLLPAAKEYDPVEFWQTLPAGYYRSMRDLDAAGADTPSGRKFLQSINDYRTICGILEGKGCRILQKAASEETAEPADGLKITILAPAKAKEDFLLELMEDIQKAETEEELRKARNRADAAMNNLSQMLLLEYGGRRILLPGDTNMNGYGEIADDIRADIFKVGHHGQKDGISLELFRKIRPSYVICCASSDRRYESAAPQILQMMEEEGAQLYFSDCPQVPPWTDGILRPHTELTFTISPDGEIQAAYR